MGSRIGGLKGKKEGKRYRPELKKKIVYEQLQAMRETRT